MTTPLPASSSQAHLILNDAFTRFESTVSPDDHRVFQDTRLQDVRDEAMKIEKHLRERHTQKNMIRLRPFLRGMDHYSKVMEVLCNGTPYLSWIWAPVKLMLMITLDSLSAFEKLIDAYGKIGDYLPRLDRLSEVLKHDHNFHTVLALVYRDIMEFHRRAYKFVRRKSWATFFGSMWAGFESRFDAILENLAYHRDLLDKEAVAIDISEAFKRHNEYTERWAQQQLEWRAVKVRAVLGWLQVGGTSPEETLENICGDSLPDSCDWFIQKDEIRVWQSDNPKHALVWLTGKPGAGKSVICSSTIRHAEIQKLNVFYHFCSYLSDPSEEGCLRLLRSLASQIIGKHQDLAMFVYENYFQTYPTASKKIMLELIPNLLRGIGSARLVIDGVDEWEAREQKELLRCLSSLLSTDSSAYICKILISSRDTLELSRTVGNLLRKFKSSALISLEKECERDAVDQSIAQFVDAELAQKTDSHFHDLDPKGHIMIRIKKSILEKANAMFLWVRLVLESLERVYSPEDLENVVNALPSGLEALYKQIFIRLCNTHGSEGWGGVPRIISWICYAQRPLHKHELLHALAIPAIDPPTISDTVPIVQILDHCKPLVEERADGTLAFVHFSVKEFFLECQVPRTIQLEQAQLDLSSVSAAILLRGLDILNPGASQADILRDVATCTYRLLPYALEFWIEHCLRYASVIAQPQAHNVLLDRLVAVHDKHSDLVQSAYVSLVEPERPKNCVEDDLDIRIGLYAHASAQTLMRAVLRERSSASQRDSAGGQDAESCPIRNEMTLFGRVGAALDSAIELLMSQDTSDVIPEDVLNNFKESHASTAFYCRFPNCQLSPVGFASDQLRAQHEGNHFRRLYCKILSCSWNRIGFDKKAALDKHTKKYHSNTFMLPVPPRIQRSSNNDTFDHALFESTEFPDDLV